MSYAVQAPVAAPRRPVTVTIAAALLALMALIGLGYAIATLAVTPGIVSRFRAAAEGLDATGADGYVTALWVGAGIAVVLGVVLFALYVALALGLRRGSSGARIGTWVVCGLGLLGGCGSAITVWVQRGSTSADALLTALGSAYPTGWIGLNIGLSIAQMFGYAVVALLVGVGTGGYFRRGHPTGPQTPVPPGAPPYPHAAPGAYQPGAYQPGPDQADPYQPGSHGLTGTPPPVPGPDDHYWARPPN
jgi:hypothetical protein